MRTSHGFRPAKLTGWRFLESSRNVSIYTKNDEATNVFGMRAVYVASIGETKRELTKPLLFFPLVRADVASPSAARRFADHHRRQNVWTMGLGDCVDRGSGARRVDRQRCGALPIQAVGEQASCDARLRLFVGIVSRAAESEREIDTLSLARFFPPRSATNRATKSTCISSRAFM
jgi:hypothetical protein